METITYQVLIMVKFFFLRLKVTEDGRQALLSLAHGDMRRVINILQSTSMAFEEVNEEHVYTCVGMKQNSRDL